MDCIRYFVRLSTLVELNPNLRVSIFLARIWVNNRLPCAVVDADLGYADSGQVCAAGSRVFVQEGIYPKFIEAFTKAAQGLGTAIGDPFAKESKHGPQVSKTQFDVSAFNPSVFPSGIP